MAAKTTLVSKFERDTVHAHTDAADVKAKISHIDAGQWLAELKSHPDLLRDMLQGLELNQAAKKFPDLVSETRAALPTPEAAYHLNRAQQTLRLWACLENGPLRPIRINGRLAWPVAGIKKLLGVV